MRTWLCDEEASGQRLSPQLRVGKARSRACDEQLVERLAAKCTACRAGDGKVDVL